MFHAHRNYVIDELWCIYVKKQLSIAFILCIKHEIVERHTGISRSWVRASVGGGSIFFSLFFSPLYFHVLCIQK